MAKQRYINTRFWDDGYVASLDPIEKLLFIYLLTNPLTEISGAYEIPLKRVALDTGIDRDMVQKILNRFTDEDKIIYRDGWIFITNFIKHQSDSEKINSGIGALVKCCPDWIKDRVSIAYGYRIDMVSHLILSNSILSNSTEAEAAGAGFMSGRSGIPREMTPVNESADRKLNDWLDAVAKVAGLKRRQNLAQFPKWVQVCMKAISEEYALDDLLAVYRSELARVGKDTQYLTPEGILQKLQSSKITAQPAKWTH